jgi:hypothetical protein
MSFTCTVGYDSDIGTIRWYKGFGLEGNPFTIVGGQTITFKYERANGGIGTSVTTPPSQVTIDGFTSDFFTNTSSINLALNGTATKTLQSGGKFTSVLTTDWNDDTVVAKIRATNNANADSDINYLEPDRFSYVADPDPYGMKIYNGSGSAIIDRFEPCYAVKELIPLDTAQSNITAYGPSNSSGVSKYVVVELTAGDYPVNNGLPIPAIKGPTGAWLHPPRIYGTHTGSPDSYRYVSCVIDGDAAVGDHELAILTNVNTVEPAVYGGSTSAYGFDLFNDNSEKTWSSQWRQGIVNNILPLQFDSATMNTNGGAAEAGGFQNASDSFKGIGNYDVDGQFPTAQYDGVYQPTACQDSVNSVSPGPGFPGEAEITFALTSTGVAKTYDNLNAMDVAKTYLLGNTTSGFVEYYAGDLRVDGVVEQANIGGGQHSPACKLINSKKAQTTMRRYVGGSTNANKLARNPDSRKPTGVFVLMRII